MHTVLLWLAVALVAVGAFGVILNGIERVVRREVVPERVWIAVGASRLLLTSVLLALIAVGLLLWLAR